MFRPDQPHLYTSNGDDQPEFGSIILSIDATLQRPDDHHVIQKYVTSTESLEESLVSLAAYFQQPMLFAAPGNLRLLRESGQCANPVFIYATPRDGLIQVVTSTDTFSMLTESAAFGKGSLLLTSEMLQKTVAGVFESLRNSLGVTPALCFFDVSRYEAPEGEGAGGEPEPEPEPEGAANELQRAEALGDER